MTGPVSLCGIIPVGSVIPFAGSDAPARWMMCFGQSLSRTTYAALFAVLSTTYGAPDASSFLLPDLRGRVVAGVDNMGGSAASRITASTITDAKLGAVGGTEAVKLTSAQSAMPSHNHSVTQSAHSHVVTDAGHSHGVTDPGHAHSIDDPGHNHSYRQATGVQAWNSSGYENGGINSTTGSSKTGITINSGKVGITVNSASSAGVSVNSATTNVSVNTAVLSTASAAHTNVQPTVLLNYIIRYE